MRVRLVFVPPGGGEADYSLDFELPAIPQTGDYVLIRREGEIGQSSFVVRRTWWALKTPETRAYAAAGDERVGSTDSIVVECEFAEGPHDSESHKGSVAMYESRGKGRLVLDDSAY